MKIIHWNGLDYRGCIRVVEEKVYWDMQDRKPKKQDR